MVTKKNITGFKDGDRVDKKVRNDVKEILRLFYQVMNWVVFYRYLLAKKNRFCLEVYPYIFYFTYCYLLLNISHCTDRFYIFRKTHRLTAFNETVLLFWHQWRLFRKPLVLFSWRQTLVGFYAYMLNNKTTITQCCSFSTRCIF